MHVWAYVYELYPNSVERHYNRGNDLELSSVCMPSLPFLLGG